MAKGLYFYKLQSKYPEDVTKDCKLTINEIDSNFEVLKDAEIKDARVDGRKLVLTRNDGEELVMDIEDITTYETPEFDVDYDSMEGTITVSYNGESYKISGLITQENTQSIPEGIMTKIYSDSTLMGNGTSPNPLSVAPVNKTGNYKPVIKFIDTIAHEKLPKKGMVKGDRYVVLEKISDYGMLYNFDGVKRINEILKDTGWRVPTKNDWDSMLNALEPCGYRNHESGINNRVLGCVAGKLLKAADDWRTPMGDCTTPPSGSCNCGQNIDSDCNSDDFDVDFSEKGCLDKPNPKPISPRGVDAYDMTILPAGFAFYKEPMLYTQFGYQGAFWTTDRLYDSDVYAKVFDHRESGVLQISERPTTFLSIRLVKDYDGSNHKGIENIAGTNYRTVLLPSLNNPNGNAVWTAQNFCLQDKCIEAYLPNGSFCYEDRRVYFIYEWTGKEWNKTEMVEGECVTVLRAEKQRWNREYRIVRGELVDEMDRLLADVEEKHNKDIERLDDAIQTNAAMISDHDKAISGLTEQMEDAQGDIARLDKELADESTYRQQQITELSNRIASEEVYRQEQDTLLANRIAEEEQTRAADVEKLTNALASEGAYRQEQDNLLANRIATEEQARANSDKELQDQIDELKNTDKNLQQEIDELKEKDEDLQGQIDALKETDKEYATRLTVLEGKALVSEDCQYDNSNGQLTLGAADQANNITIGLNFNFGTC